MRSTWKGSISFGLVNIPIALGTAVREEGLKFRMLRAGDLSPIKFKRVAETDGKEVPHDKIVKGAGSGHPWQKGNGHGQITHQ